MAALCEAAALFLAIHLLVSGTRLRDGIVSVIGEGVYAALFSIASLGALVWLVISYNAAQKSGPDPLLYDLGVGVRHVGIPLVALAFFIGVQGLFMPNPASIRQEAAAGREGTIKGVLRITRHPFLWGVAIWSAFHLAANGDQASVVLFGTLFLVAFLGTFSIDAKRKRKMGAAWGSFTAKTSNIPFAAVLSGRTSLRLGESFGWRFWITVAIFLVFLFAHARVIGVSPFPGGWRPF